MYDPYDPRNRTSLGEKIVTAISVLFLVLFIVIALVVYRGIS